MERLTFLKINDDDDNDDDSLTVMPWTTTDEFNIIPKTQPLRMSLESFPGICGGQTSNSSSMCMEKTEDDNNTLNLYN